MLKTGMSEAEVLALLEADTWLTADEALAKGLIDGILEFDVEPDAVEGVAPAAQLANMARAGTRQLMNAMPAMTPGVLERRKVLLTEPAAAPAAAEECDEAHRLAQARLALEQKRYGGIEE